MAEQTPHDLAMADLRKRCSARIGATFFAKGVKASTVIMSIRGQVAFAAKEAARAWQKHGEAG